MAWKIKQEYVRDGDVVEPSEWRININETASELNGFLDSDNITVDSIENDQILRNTFTEVFSSTVSPNSSFLFNHEKSGWQRTGLKLRSQDILSSTMKLFPSESYGNPGQILGNFMVGVEENAKLPHVTFSPDTDGLLICEFNGWVQWNNYSTHPDHINDDGSYDKTVLDKYHSYGFFAKQNEYWKHLSSYVLCSQWRLVVNGQVIAESGPLGCEYQCHPIYLCGATPILKNTETTVQLEASFIWYSLGKDQSLQAAAFAPNWIKPIKRRLSVDTGDTSGRVKVTESKDTTYRNDCSLQNPCLTVTYRKR